MAGSLGQGACRDTLIYGAGNRNTLGTGAALVILGDGTGGITLGSAGSRAVKVVVLGVFIRVIGNRVGNGRVGRCSCWF